MICVAGMPRSGTSLVTQLLHRCGLYLGPSEQLMPPSQNNTDGYWENVRFVGLNERLLEAGGGTWFAPPATLRVTPAIDRDARALVAQFDGCEPWGWKDPRNAVTLPFWKSLLPGLKVVVCVRHPAESAASLAASTLMPRPWRFVSSVARPDSPIRFSSRPSRVAGAVRATLSKQFREQLVYQSGLDLWRIYNERALAHTAPGERLVTHYSAVLEDPRRELERILAFAGIHVPAAKLDEVVSIVSVRMRHQRAEASPLSPALDSLYARLCAGAPV